MFRHLWNTRLFNVGALVDLHSQPGPFVQLNCLAFGTGRQFKREFIMIEVQQAMTQQGQVEVNKDLFIAQYSSLRSEIHQRVDQRQQLLTYTLVGAASFFSIGVQPGISGVTVLCYPILSFFLACAWGQHDNRIHQINGFLQDAEDFHLGALGPGWESYRRAIWKKSRRTLSSSVTLPARGLFVGSQLLALVIGLARFSQDQQMAVLFVLLIAASLLAILMTMLVLRRRSARTGIGAVEKGDLS
jgi:hypothetical protein